MLGRIVEIGSDNRHLSVDRGHLLIRGPDEQKQRVALDDIAVLICNAHGLTCSANLVLRLAERGAVVVFCGANHLPTAWTLPIVGHHEQSGRMRAQLAASPALRKRLWQRLVRAKVENQAAVLGAVGISGEALASMARRVKPGDPDNLEGLAAQRYWPLLFGEGFRRNPDGGGANALLNWGYAVLRSAVARAVVGAGLHPTPGIHHRSAVNPMCLVDDVMEPFRPFVDLAVRRLVEEGNDEVGRESKARLVAVLYADLEVEGETSPMFVCLERLTVSLARSFREGRVRLVLPHPPTALELAPVGRETC
ncbi:MAG TPA: type II CRISPR-associated endonuclease Cas1 [Rhodospirillales bacterium]|nr:type II CRISPR-associated endonuclease Cas1 [Rhodospirillales bacterium]